MSSANHSTIDSRERRNRPRRAAAARMSLCLLLVFTLASEVLAHNPGESYLYLQIYSDRVAGRFEIELGDVNEALGLSGTESEITVENVDERIGFLQQYYLDHVRISSAGRPLSINFTTYEVLRVRSGYAQLVSSSSSTTGRRVRSPTRTRSR